MPMIHLNIYLFIFILFICIIYHIYTHLLFNITLILILQVKHSLNTSFFAFSFFCSCCFIQFKCMHSFDSFIYFVIQMQLCSLCLFLFHYISISLEIILITTCNKFLNTRKQLFFLFFYVIEAKHLFFHKNIFNIFIVVQLHLPHARKSSHRRNSACIHCSMLNATKTLCVVFAVHASV